MISAWWLLLIVPVSACVGLLVAGLCVTSRMASSFDEAAAMEKARAILAPREPAE